MKAKSALFSALFAIGCLGGISCERHSWDETKGLHGSHSENHDPKHEKDGKDPKPVEGKEEAKPH